MNDDVLTLDKFTALMEKFPPPPFMAFTFSPASYVAMRAQFKPHPLDGPNTIDGVEVWEVRTQEADCLQWNDKELLRSYLKMHGVIEDDAALSDDQKKG